MYNFPVPLQKIKKYTLMGKGVLSLDKYTWMCTVFLGSKRKLVDFHYSTLIPRETVALKSRKETRLTVILSSCETFSRRNIKYGKANKRL